ncbi:MAG: hypothetical protein AUI93_01850 [Crenarchaeota archaeon 13_1_40CM_3_52_10]|nr:MAG: hypothetical protein AUI93_01850 [Crenarchaeota archaeon 13_1_40CM_3_52_10]
MAESNLARLVPGYGYGETRKTLDTDRRVRDILRIELGKGVMSMQEVVDVAQRANQRSMVEEARRVKDEIEQFIDDIRTAPAAFHRDVRKDEAERLVEFDTQVIRQCKEVVVAASLLHEKFLKSEPQDIIGEVPSVRKLVRDARGKYKDREAVLKEVQGAEAYV